MATIETFGWDGADRVTLERYARDYVARLVKPSRETRRKYLERLSRHVFPDLGDQQLTAITRRIMREWQQGMLAAALSAKTIANVRGEVLYPMFEASCLPGEDDEPALRTYNPLKGLPLPDRDELERDILETAEESALFLACAYEVDQDAADLILTALATGMRWGELAGLPVRPCIASGAWSPSSRSWSANTTPGWSAVGPRRGTATARSLSRIMCSMC